MATATPATTPATTATTAAATATTASVIMRSKGATTARTITAVKGRI